MSMTELVENIVPLGEHEKYQYCNIQLHVLELLHLKEKLVY